MPATGGKAYMLLVEDIRELSQSDEYRYIGKILHVLSGIAVCSFNPWIKIFMAFPLFLLKKPIQYELSVQFASICFIDWLLSHTKSRNVLKASFLLTILQKNEIKSCPSSSSSGRMLRLHLGCSI